MTKKMKVEPTTNNSIDEAVLKRVSTRIQEVLDDEGFGIQPFLDYTTYAVVPRVRLVKIEKEEKANEEIK